MDYVGTKENWTLRKRRYQQFMVYVITSLIIIMSGCTNNKNTNTPESQAKSISTQMINYFQEKDSGNLKLLFSQYIQKTYDIDTQITDAFNFIDGDIVSYNEPYGQAAEKSSDIKGTIYEEIKGEVTSVKTNTDKIYNIYFFSYREYRDYEDHIGVYCMMIVSKNDSNKNEKVFIGNLDE